MMTINIAALEVAAPTVMATFLVSLPDKSESRWEPGLGPEPPLEKGSRCSVLVESLLEDADVGFSVVENLFVELELKLGPDPRPESDSELQGASTRAAVRRMWAH